MRRLHAVTLQPSGTRLIHSRGVPVTWEPMCSPTSARKSSWPRNQRHRLPLDHCFRASTRNPEKSRPCCKQNDTGQWNVLRCSSADSRDGPPHAAPPPALALRPHLRCLPIPSDRFWSHHVNRPARFGSLTLRSSPLHSALHVETVRPACHSSPWRSSE